MPGTAGQFGRQPHVRCGLHSFSSCFAGLKSGWALGEGTEPPGAAAGTSEPGSVLGMHRAKRRTDSHKLQTGGRLPLEFTAYKVTFVESCAAIRNFTHTVMAA